jgi:lysophospholipase L1-like esterase
MLSSQRIRYVRNAGVPGDTTAQMLARFDTDVTPYAPKAVIVTGGTNDTGASVALPTIAANLQAIVAKIRAIGARPILTTIPPTSSVNPVDRSARVSALNSWIRRYGAAVGIPVIDICALLMDPATGGYLAEYDSGDGVHPSGGGYRAIAAHVASEAADLGYQASSPLLAQRNTDAANLVANGLFLDGASGAPTGWTMQNSAGVTKATVAADSGSPGNWWQATAEASAGVQIAYQSIASMTAGNVYRLAARVKATAVTAGSWTVLIRPKNAAGDGLGDIFPAAAVTQAIDGVCEIEFAAPAGCTNGQLQIQVSASATLVLNIGQVTLYDLTAMGVA